MRICSHNDRMHLQCDVECLLFNVCSMLNIYFYIVCKHWFSNRAKVLCSRRNIGRTMLSVVRSTFCWSILLWQTTKSKHQKSWRTSYTASFWAESNAHVYVAYTHAKQLRINFGLPLIPSASKKWAYTYCLIVNNKLLTVRVVHWSCARWRQLRFSPVTAAIRKGWSMIRMEWEVHSF